MRTTLTLDDDVAAALEQLRRASDASFKDLVNDTLRRGLKDVGSLHKVREEFRTRTVALGRPRLASIDNISDVLAIAERDGFK